MLRQEHRLVRLQPGDRDLERDPQLLRVLPAVVYDSGERDGGDLGPLRGGEDVEVLPEGLWRHGHSSVFSSTGLRTLNKQLYEVRQVRLQPGDRDLEPPSVSVKIGGHKEVRTIHRYSMSDLPRINWATSPQSLPASSYIGSREESST